MKLLIKLIVIASILFIFPGSDKAEGDIESRDQILDLVEDAAHAQISLSEKWRSMNEIKKILAPYLTEKYMERYLKENLVSEEGRFMTYGSDFSPYFIPFFAFTSETKVITEKNKAYVFEYFDGSDIGPVSYPSHYEGLLLKKVDGSWKVSKYLYDDIPKAIIKKANKPSGKF